MWYWIYYPSLEFLLTSQLHVYALQGSLFFMLESNKALPKQRRMKQMTDKNIDSKSLTPFAS